LKYSDIITTLGDIERLYDAFIFDIWGVIYDGETPYEGSVEVVNKIINQSKPLFFLSNTPRPSEITKIKLSQFGINMDKAQVYTSGDSVREQLISWNDNIFKNLGKNLYHLGAERNEDILRDLDVKPVAQIEEADFVLLTIYLDEDEDLTKYNDILNKAFNLKLPVICANPDVTVAQGSKIRYTAGFFAKKYEELGGVVHYYGKPDNKVFDKVLSSLSELGITDKNKILMVGDTMETDIKGASMMGIKTLLLLTGNGVKIANNMEVLKNYPFGPSFIMNKLK
jgi:HAD superfamily hydrolase (TIGR01459 family)